MAYQNTYFPVGYQPYQQPSYQQISQPQIQPQAQTPAQNMITWVQGEAAARSYYTAPGQSVLLMDSDASVFYIKSADASGMPMPLRVFDYTERTQQPHSEPQAQQKTPSVEYITRDEFESRISELMNVKKAPVVRKEKTE